MRGVRSQWRGGEAFIRPNRLDWSSVPAGRRAHDKHANLANSARPFHVRSIARRNHPAHSTSLSLAGGPGATSMTRNQNVTTRKNTTNGISRHQRKFPESDVDYSMTRMTRMTQNRGPFRHWGPGSPYELPRLAPSFCVVQKCVIEGTSAGLTVGLDSDCATRKRRLSVSTFCSKWHAWFWSNRPMKIDPHCCGPRSS